MKKRGESTPESVFESNGLALAYQRFGKGDRQFIAFHGYGQSANVYRSLPDSSMTVYSFNLPFHSSSKGLLSDAQVREGLSPAQLNGWVHEFILSKSIERCSLLGYSMGARLVLAMVEHLSTKLDSVHLIAPDGFIINPAYRFATRTRLGRYLFSKLPLYQRGVIALAGLWHRIGFLDQRVLRLVERHIADSEAARQLYNTWTFLRKIHPDIEKDSLCLAMRSMAVIVYFGEEDTIIPLNKVVKWRGLREEIARAKFFSLGHRLLVEEVFSHVRLADLEH